MNVFAKVKIVVIFVCFLLFTAFFIWTIFFTDESTHKTFKKEMITPTRMVSRRAQFAIKVSIPYWDYENASSSFRKNVKVVSYLNLFWYYVTHEGRIATYQYAKENKEIIDFARSNNVKVFAVITNLPEQGSWDSHRVELAIRDRASREKHIANIIDTLEQFGFDGVDIDYEEVNASAKEDFSQFIQELSSALHRKGKILAVALHPKTRRIQKGNGVFQDWRELSRHADHLNIMAYGEHWDEGEAGPIASVDWVKSIIEYTERLAVPREKFFLGIPLYGYDWNKDDDSAARGLTYTDVQSLLDRYGEEERWNESVKSPSFLYTKNGDRHEVWFENTQSVREKIRLAENAGFGGVSFWRLGGEDPGIWSTFDGLH